MNRMLDYSYDVEDAVGRESFTKKLVYNEHVLFTLGGKPVTREYVRKLEAKVEKLRTYKTAMKAMQKAIDDRNRRIDNLLAQNSSLVNKMVDIANQQENELNVLVETSYGS